MAPRQQILIKVPIETEEQKISKYHGFELKTVNGYKLDEVVSALQKSIRRGQEERALYWMSEMVQGGFIAYFWRRMSVIVVEDIALANPEAVVLINALAQLNERVNRKDYIETFHPAMAILYLCRSSKSREIDYFCDWIDRKRELGWREKIEIQDLDEHNEAGRERIRKQAKAEGRDYRRLCDEIFYYESILLNKPVSIASDKYKKKIWDLRKLDKRRLNLKYRIKI